MSILGVHCGQFIPDSVLFEVRLDMDPRFLSVAFFMEWEVCGFSVLLPGYLRYWGTKTSNLFISQLDILMKQRCQPCLS